MGLRAFWAEFKTFAFKGNMIDLAVAVVIGAAFSGVINSLVSDIIMPGIIYLTTTASKAGEIAAQTAKNAGGALGIATTQPAATQPTTVPAATPEEQTTALQLVGSINGNLAAAKSPLDKAGDDFQKLQDIKAGMPPDVQKKIHQAATDLKAARDAAAPPAPPAPAPPPAQPKAVDFSWTVGPFKIGSFIGALINFVLIALAVFVTIVKLLGSVMKRMGPKAEPKPSEPVTKECPFCLSIIPIKAKKCAHCTADMPAVATA